MRRSLVAFMLVMSCVQVLAGNNNAKFMSEWEQRAYVEEIAESLEEQAWGEGRRKVQVSIEKVTDPKFKDMFSYVSNRTFEQPLSKDEIIDILDCLDGMNSCQLFRVVVISQGSLGYQTDVEYVMLSTRNATHTSIGHILYAE